MVKVLRHVDFEGKKIEIRLESGPESYTAGGFEVNLDDVIVPRTAYAISLDPNKKFIVPEDGLSAHKVKVVAYKFDSGTGTWVECSDGEDLSGSKFILVVHEK